MFDNRYFGQNACGFNLCNSRFCMVLVQILYAEMKKNSVPRESNRANGKKYLKLNIPKINNSWTVISLQEIEVHQPKSKDWVKTNFICFLLLLCSLEAQIEWRKVITWQSGKPDITKDFLYCSTGLCTAEHNQPQPFKQETEITSQSCCKWSQSNYSITVIKMTVLFPPLPT